MKALYSNIKALRIAKGWSQEEFALRLGYKDRSMLAKIEAGKVDITVGKVETNTYIVFVGGYIGIVCPREL